MLSTIGPNNQLATVAISLRYISKKYLDPAADAATEHWVHWARVDDVLVKEDLARTAVVLDIQCDPTLAYVRTPHPPSSALLMSHEGYVRSKLPRVAAQGRLLVGVRFGFL